MRKTRVPWPLRGAGIGLAVAAAVWLAPGGLFRSLERATFDQRMVLRQGPLPADPPMRLVAVDDASAEQHPRWLAEREDLARVIGFVADSGARLILLDVSLVTPATGDRSLAAALARAGHVVGPVFQRPDGLSGLQGMVPVLAEALAGQGLVEFPLDDDGVLRRAALHPLADGPPLLPLTAALRWEGAEVASVHQQAGVLAWGSHRVPLLADGTVAIPFRAGPGAVPAVSYREVLAAASGDSERLDAATARALFQDRLVLLGSTSRREKDRYQVPVSRAKGGGTVRLMPGVEIHAQLFSALLRDDFLVPAGPLPNLALLAAACVASALAGLRLVGWRAAAAAGALLLLVASGLVAVFLRSALVMEMARPMVGILVAFGAGMAVRVVQTRRLLREFVPVGGEFADEGGLPAGFEGEREVSVLFYDIEEYTRYCFENKDSPRTVLAMLQEMHRRTNPALSGYGGEVMDYQGDNAMVVFGLARSVPHPERGAVRSAFGLLKALRDLRREQGQAYLPVGVGIATGVVAVGVVGTEARRQVVSIGSTVNLAARLVGVSKKNDHAVAVCAETQRRLADLCEFREMEDHLKGFDEMKVYVVSSVRPEAFDEMAGIQ